MFRLGKGLNLNIQAGGTKSFPSCKPFVREYVYKWQEEESLDVSIIRSLSPDLTWRDVLKQMPA